MLEAKRRTNNPNSSGGGSSSGRIIEPSVFVEFNNGDDGYELKHQRWLQRRSFISKFVAFLIVSVVLVFTSVYIRDHHNRQSINQAGSVQGVTAENKASSLRLEQQQQQQQEQQQLEAALEREKAVVKEQAQRGLQEKCDTLITKIRELKSNGVVVEESVEAKEKVQALQESLRVLVPMLYGPEPYLVDMTLQFPASMPDFVTNGEMGKITFELAPLKYAPYSTYFFLGVMNNWKGGAFHRNAGHVLQALVHGSRQGDLLPLAFQEYHEEFPHKQYTMGYAGRPGGPEFYISTVDNVSNHGPGSQGSRTEADACFARIIPSETNIATVKRMQKQPGRTKPSGFIDKPENYIQIKSLKLQ